MKPLIKTLFGDLRTVGCVVVAILIATFLLATPAREAIGIIVPFVLLVGAGYLACH